MIFMQDAHVFDSDYFSKIIVYRRIAHMRTLVVFHKYGIVTVWMKFVGIPQGQTTIFTIIKLHKPLEIMNR